MNGRPRQTPSFTLALSLSTPTRMDRLHGRPLRLRLAAAKRFRSSWTMKVERISAFLRAAQPHSLVDIYDRAGAAYGAYADGATDEIGAFSGPHGQADRCVWSCLT